MNLSEKFRRFAAECEAMAKFARSPEIKATSTRRQRDSPGRNGLQASAARGQLGFIVPDIGQQQRGPHRHAAQLFDEVDKLLDTQRFLISGVRAASPRETIRRGLGLKRS